MPKLFLGNLGNDCRQRDIERLFDGFGELRNVNIKGQYGFLELDDKRDAEDAIREVNGKSFNGGSRIRVEYASGNDRGGDRDRRGGGDRNGYGDRDRDNRGRGRQVSDGKFRRTNYRLVVENLSSRTSWQDLKDFMRKAGEITYTTVNRGESGEGLVEFADRESMDYALKELDDTKLDGKRIRLVEEKKNSSRSRSRSNRRGNRRSESKRSKSRSNDRRQEKTKRQRSETPDEKSRSRSNDRGEKDLKRRSLDRRSEEKTRRQRSETPEDKGRDRSTDRARSKDRAGSKDRAISEDKDMDNEKRRSCSRSP